MRVTPRGGADRVDGVGEGGQLLVRVRASATDGQANEAALRTIAEELGIGRSRLDIVRGHTARNKLVEVEGFAVSALVTRWPGLQVSGG